MIGARDQHLATFKRLPQCVERLLREFGELVEKQDALMRQRDFTRFGAQTAADKGCHRSAVVRGAKWARARQTPAFQQARHRMQHRHFEQFLTRERRQKPRQTLRQHGFARARRTNEQNVVRTRGCNFERALGLLLSAHVTQIRHVFAGDEITAFRRFQHRATAKMVHEG